MNRISFYNKLVFYVLTSIFLGACGSTATPISEKPIGDIVALDNTCLLPIYGGGFSYPVDASPGNLSYPGLDMKVLPPEPWQIEVSLPQFDGLTKWERRNLGVVQVRHFNNYLEVWIHVSKGLEKMGYLAVFRTDTKKWNVIPEQIDTLIVDKKGAMFGSHSGYFGYASEPFDNRILSKYDEDTSSFIAINELQGLPSVTEKNGHYFYSQVLYDTDGIFWILVPMHGIYKFNPTSGSLEKKFELLGGFRDAKIASDGIIYVLFNDYYYLDGMEYFDYILKTYNTKTGKEGEYALVYYLEPYPKPFTLMIDSQERVWLDNIAYIEKGILYQIQRSPLFVSPIREQYNDYRYKRADVLLESSDGRIWFRHQNGMIWLDPPKNKWCWFTTYQSNIVEDSEHNLWMIADGKLYKYPLGETK